MTTPSARRQLVSRVKSLATWAVLAVSLLVLAACKEERPLRDVTLALSWLHSSQYCGAYYADQHGLYAKEGLRVTFVPASKERDPVDEFVSGKYDFTFVQPDSLAKARLDGHEIKALAATFRLHPLGFASLEGSGVTGPKDFAGKTVGAPFSTKAPLYAMLKKMGVDPRDVTLAKHTDDFEDLKRGEIDIKAVWVINELQAARRAGVKLNAFSLHDYGIAMYADVLAARETMIEQEPEVVQGFVRATLRGWEEALKDPEKSAELMRRYEPTFDLVHERDRVKASAPLIHTGVDRIGWMRADEWEQMLQTLHQEGVIPAVPAVDALFTTRFIDAPPRS